LQLQLPPLSKKFPDNPQKWERLIAESPEHVDDPQCPYDPNDPCAVAAYWKDAVVTRSLAEVAARRTRGSGSKPKKILLSVRYSPEVVEFFKSTGPSWQTRIDEALKEWIREHR
jgi:uncharacterized protein (DUF4415 family)